MMIFYCRLLEEEFSPYLAYDRRNFNSSVSKSTREKQTYKQTKKKSLSGAYQKY